MAETTSQQLDWVKAFLGFDAGNALVGGGGAAPKSAGKPSWGRNPFAKAKGGEADAAGKAADEKPFKDKALAAKFKTYDDAGKALKASGFETKPMDAERKDLAAQAGKAEAKILGREKAVAAVGKRLDEEIEHVNALAKSLKDVMGTGTGAPTDDQKSQAYKTALEDHYGLQIEVPAGMTNTHFDKVYDMFGSVPKGDVKQDKLKKLKYNTANIGGVFYYDDCKIEMGNFGDATGEEDYDIGGKTVKANSFNVTTLHEIGHSLDFKHNIMNSNQSKPGCGGWKVETLAGVTNAFVTALLKSVKPGPKVTAKILAPVVEAALKDGTTVQPNDIENADWPGIETYLIDKCVPTRDASQPYFKDTPSVIGDRAYTESQGTWYSYGAGARKATKVNLYQWRSPPEWFAEVYAITWLKKARPPTAVDKSVADHCWKG